MFTRRSGCYTNLMQYHDDSLKESLKETMLNQENLFRKQVQELHRLYQIQMIMMKKLRLREVLSTQSLDYFRQDCRVNCLKRYDQKPLDLEVPVSSHVSNFDKHFLNKRNGWGTRENPVEVEDSFPGETESSLEEAQLSLSIGRETSERMNDWRPQNEKVHFVVPQDTSQLEGLIGTVFSGDVKLNSALCCSACCSHFGGRNGFRASCSCTCSMGKYLTNSAQKYQTHRNESMNILENCLSQGNKKRLENLPETELAVAGKAFPSHGAACLDLNSQPDESSLDWKHPKMEYSSAAVSSGVVVGECFKGLSSNSGSWIKPSDNSSTHFSDLLQHETPNSVLLVCKRTGSNTTNPSGSKMFPIDLELYPTSPSNCSEDHDYPCKIDESKPDFPSRNCKDENVTEVILEKGDEVLVDSCLCSSGETVEDVATDKRPPASSKSDHIAQEDPSSSTKTMQSGTYLEKSFSRMNSFQNSDTSQVDSSAIGESNPKSSDEENGGSAHEDPVIQKGAVSLAYFLLEARREHDCIAAVIKKTNDVGRGKIDQPECSMDSFESVVLKLQESNSDDYCVSSNPYDVNNMVTKDCGIKLRRGRRRLKDFQKEILPSLPSLSRQEICEDIRIMEGAIRSREYKRFRSKITTEQKWFTPVRSRRSRLNYIGRRRCYK